MLRPVSRLLAAAAALLAAGSAFAEEPKVVNVYNWADYVAKDTLERFSKETGIKVNYDTYDDNEVLDAKLMAGRSGYDVVFPSASPFFARGIQAGIYRKLDPARLPNAAGLDKAQMATLARHDPGNAHGLPYMRSATGFGYNIDKIKALLPDAPVDSWRMLFDPAVVAKLKGCGVSLLNTPTEVIPAMLAYLGRDPASQTQADLDAAAQALMPLRPNYRYINSAKYREDLANGEICLAHGYVGDLVQSRTRAEKTKKKPRIAIVIPKEGAEVNIDVMAIPADAPHPDNAHRFIDFLLRPDVIAAISNETGYANGVPASAGLLDPALRSDPVVYPPAEVEAKLFILPNAAKDYEKARTKAWTSFRTAKK